MFSLRVASRVLAPSSSSLQLSVPRALARAYSSEQTSGAPQLAEQSEGSTHRTQRAPRTRSLRQTTESAGAMAKLVELAVKNTAASGAEAKANGERPASRREGQFRLQEDGTPRPPRPQRPQGQRPPRRQPAEGEAAAQQSSEGTALQPRRPSRPQQQRRPPRNLSEAPTSVLGAALSSRRGPLSPEAQALRRPGPRSPSSASGPGGSRNPSSSGPRKPAQQKRDRKPAYNAGASIFSKEQSEALKNPSAVLTPTANLAKLLRADLVARTLEVKHAVGQKLVDENAEKQEDREQARKVLGGDYSVWTEAGKGVVEGSKGKKEALEHARGILTLNPSVGIVGREVLLNKVKEALL
ncbi:hypothetical protein JCM8547_007838 [Rhodosporidiobolus lusitaniae]